MKVIKEYRLSKEELSTQTLYITKNADIVKLVDLDFGLVLITICDKAEFAADLRTFKIYSTLETVYEDNIRYIGTFGPYGNQHVIEIL